MKFARLLLIAAALFQAACEKPAPVTQIVAKPVVDLTRLFPMTNRGDVNIAPDYPAGSNLAHYKNGKQEYDLFLIKTKSNEAAALVAFDFKTKLKNPKFVPGFGGYYGLDAEMKIFVFPKLAYVAGVIGLTEKEADPIARDFASRIH